MNSILSKFMTEFSANHMSIKETGRSFANFMIAKSQSAENIAAILTAAVHSSEAYWEALSEASKVGISENTEFALFDGSIIPLSQISQCVNTTLSNIPYDTEGREDLYSEAMMWNYVRTKDGTILSLQTVIEGFGTGLASNMAYSTALTSLANDDFQADVAAINVSQKIDDHFSNVVGMSKVTSHIRDILSSSFSVSSKITTLIGEITDSYLTDDDDDYEYQFCINDQSDCFTMFGGSPASIWWSDLTIDIDFSSVGSAIVSGAKSILKGIKNFFSSTLPNVWDDVKEWAGNKYFNPAIIIDNGSDGTVDCLDVPIFSVKGCSMDDLFPSNDSHHYGGFQNVALRTLFREESILYRQVVGSISKQCSTVFDSDIMTVRIKSHSDSIDFRSKPSVERLIASSDRRFFHADQYMSEYSTLRFSGSPGISWELETVVDVANGQRIRYHGNLHAQGDGPKELYLISDQLGSRASIFDAGIRGYSDRKFFHMNITFPAPTDDSLSEPINCYIQLASDPVGTVGDFTFETISQREINAACVTDDIPRALLFSIDPKGGFRCGGNNFTISSDSLNALRSAQLANADNRGAVTYSIIGEYSLATGDVKALFSLVGSPEYTSRTGNLFDNDPKGAPNLSAALSNLIKQDHNIIKRASQSLGLCFSQEGLNINDYYWIIDEVIIADLYYGEHYNNSQREIFGKTFTSSFYQTEPYDSVCPESWKFTPDNMIAYGNPLVDLDIFLKPSIPIDDSLINWALGNKTALDSYPAFIKGSDGTIYFENDEMNQWTLYDYLSFIFPKDEAKFTECKTETESVLAFKFNYKRALTLLWVLSNFYDEGDPDVDYTEASLIDLINNRSRLHDSIRDLMNVSHNVFIKDSGITHFLDDAIFNNAHSMTNSYDSTEWLPNSNFSFMHGMGIEISKDYLYHCSVPSLTSSTGSLSHVSDDSLLRKLVRGVIMAFACQHVSSQGILSSKGMVPLFIPYVETDFAIVPRFRIATDADSKAKFSLFVKTAATATVIVAAAIFLGVTVRKVTKTLTVLSAQVAQLNRDLGAAPPDIAVEYIYPELRRKQFRLKLLTAVSGSLGSVPKFVSLDNDNTKDSCQEEMLLKIRMLDKKIGF